ncbi:MAG: hypothetical protein HZA91_19840 [Verrucomicrobia bacterium]|nr:hypothetical protein [Verrucomicrobiota bacterium]
MKTLHHLLIALGLACAVAFAAEQGGDIDFNRAREIFQRKQNGETISADDQAYLQKAMQAHQRQQQVPNAGGGDIDWQRAGELHRRAQSGEKLSAEDQAYYEKAKAARQQREGKGKGGEQRAATGPATGGKDSVGLTPLTELGAAKYKGEDGGLYGGGKNEPPPAHAAAAKKELAKIQPLDAEGKPSADGKVVLLSVGMSNTTQEFSRFKQLADADPEKSSKLVIVDGAQGGQAAAQWAASSDSRVWQTADERMKTAGVSDKQVQVVWLKQANIRPTEEFPAHAKKLAADVTMILHLLKAKFPNLRVAYLGSRIYAGYATTQLNPEPFSYEGAFAMRWLIQDQIKGDAQLNYDPARGEVKSPLLLWGPYLWGDGMKPRKSDGFTWTRNDLVPGDGTHPSPAGRQKVAELLLKFFKSDAGARTWFAAKP